MKRFLSLSHARRGFPFFLMIQAVLLLLLMMILWACTSEKKPEAQHMAVDVTVVKTQAQDVPVSIEFVGQTQSSHQVEIRARVEGFLEKRTYEEGSLVKAGQVMFQMDRRPFEASLQEAKGELAQQQARWDTAKANLARIQPLAAKNAVSKKDLDDAIGNEKSAAAAVISAQGKVRQAELNLSYTTITSPVGGASGQAKKQEGSYISMGPESLLTYVAKLDPIWVNFSVSENERMKQIEETKKGTIKLPPGEDFTVELVLSDGTVFPRKGRLNFADPSFSQETGTFLVRGTFANPYPYLLRPGQFVRVRLYGAVRPNAITIPRRAVLQGAKGHFVWVVDKNNQAEFRNVTVGDWYGDSCFISDGLKASELVVVDGGMKLAPGIPVKSTPVAAPGSPPQGAPAGAQTPKK
ncbi:MAG: Multidrug efflux pump [Syntrophus sp. SKADARSKE-3]|nr:Multidrug efflux pump [Syntrophus sp. SKADARSKE-3]